METKICTICGTELPLTEEYYHKRNDSISGFRTDCKKCVCNRVKRYRQENPQKIKKNKKRYHYKNKEKIKEHQKKYYSKNSEEIKEKVKRYRQNNKTKVAEYKKSYYENNAKALNEYKQEWYLKNKEHIKELRKEYKQNNKEKIGISRHKRRAKRKELPAFYTIEHWNQAKMYFEDKCAYCGEKSKLTQDHFIPISKGGEYTINNILPSCKNCNSKKHNADFFSWYPLQPFYNKTRERKILKYLNYKGEIQQLSITI